MTPSPAQQQQVSLSSHHCIDNGGLDSPAIMTTTTTTTSAIPSSFQQHLATDVPQPRDSTHHDNHYTQQHARNQRSHSVNALPSDLQQQQHEQKQRLSSHEEEQPHQPWWQYYYQLYHYHPPQGRKPTVFGPYLLLQTLGEGEFGKVKLAVHIKTGQEVAIKLIKKDNLDSSTRMIKVEREISVLRKVRHPYIVKLYDVIETERYIGIILQCASGGELFEYILAHRYLKEKDASRLFAQLISGVHYMHQKHIVHRDLKLENLLLDRDRCIVITDFGFANQFSSAKDDLMSTSCGSPCYAAPELVISEGMYVGSAVDIWSCGVILYAMLCGYLPFDDDPANPDGDNINLLYKYILNTELAFPDYVSSEARDLLQKMLVPNPANRCTMDTIMQHPWLSQYRSLFEKSIKELEIEAIDAADLPMPVVPDDSPEPSTSLVDSKNQEPEQQDNNDADDTMNEDVPAEDNEQQNVDDVPATPLPESRNDTLENNEKEDAQYEKPTTTTSANVQEKDDKDDDDDDDDEPMRERHGVSLDLPSTARRTEDIRLSQQLPRPTRTTSKRVHQRGTEMLKSFLSRNASSNGNSYRTSITATPPDHHPQQRPTSLIPGQSILHSKLLSSLQRQQQQQQHLQNTTAQIDSRLAYISSTQRSTSTGIAYPDQPPTEPTSPKPTSYPSSRGTRRKALSLLVNPLSSENGKPNRSLSRRGRPTFSRPASQQKTPTPSASEQLSPSSSKKSAGKKFMEWFKKTPLSTHPHRSSANYTTTRFNDARLRTYHGAVDQNALTSASPPQLVMEMKHILIAIGIDVKQDGEYKLKCVRRQRHQPMPDNPSRSTTSKPNHPNDIKKRRMSINNSQNAPTTRLRMLLRRHPPLHGNTQAAAADLPSSNNNNSNNHDPAGASAILYGDPVVDPGEEVRFSMEVCKIKNLPGLYIVDIRRMRGNVWSYKFLYHAVLGALDLGRKGGGYMAVSTPTDPNAMDTLQQQHHHQQRSSIVSSSNNSSSVIDEGAVSMIKE